MSTMAADQMLDEPPPAPPVTDLAAAGLTTRWLGRRHEWLAACASTNDVCTERARAGAEAGLVIAADTQTAGRGRLGRSWHSPPGDNLYVSLLLRPKRAPAEIPPLTLLAGAAVADAVAALGLLPRLKWPNDVQLVDRASDGGVRRRKLAGILTEMATSGASVEHVVVGIGINVNGVDFPPDLADRATSVALALGRRVARAELLASVLNAFEPRYDDFVRRGPAAAVDAFGAHAALPERCRVDDRLQGTALRIDADGALIVRDDAGRIHRVVSGEIHT
jgi:BirA family biotin operon repressor/biotin-[acetyl-CoA-carboxylase] ligase